MNAIAAAPPLTIREWATASQYGDDGRNVCELVSPVAGVRTFVVDGPPRPDRYDIVRRLLARHAGGSAGGWQIVRRRGRPPMITPPREKRPPTVSMARTGSRMVVALTGHEAIGVDVETVDRVRSIATPSDEWLSAAEQEMCAADASGLVLAGCWTLKEALGKALGVGFPDEPAAWSFDIRRTVGATGIPCPARFWLGSYDGSVIALALPTSSSTTR